jgi:hypothetical protein
MPATDNTSWLKVFDIFAAPIITIILCLGERSYGLYESGLLYVLAVLVIATQILGAILLYRLVRSIRRIYAVMAFSAFAAGPIGAAAIGDVIGAPLHVHGLSMPVWVLSTASAWIASLIAIFATIFKRT